MEVTWQSLVDSILPLPAMGPYRASTTKPTLVYVNRASGAEVRARTPGLNWYRTCPRGMDLAAEMHDPARPGSPARYGDVFTDVANKTSADEAFMKRRFSEALVRVTCLNEDAAAAGRQLLASGGAVLPGLPVDGLLVFLLLVQVPEHYRYDYMEPRGGRFLMPRFTLGVIHRAWPPSTAKDRSASGVEGLRYVRRRYGREPAFGDVVAHPSRDGCGCY